MSYFDCLLPPPFTITVDDIGRQKAPAAAAAAALSPSAKPTACRRTDLFSDEVDAAKEKRDRRLKRAISKARSKRKLFSTDDGRARPNMFVDWMRLSKKKMTVLSNPRLMENNLKTEQKY